MALLEVSLLIIEDNILAQKLAQTAVDQLVKLTDVAATGRKALQLIQQQYYHFIFMDLGLPDTDGITLTGQIRTIQQQSQQPPSRIIALTAHSDHELRDRALAASMNGYLTKPITIEKAQMLMKEHMAEVIL